MLKFMVLLFAVAAAQAFAYDHTRVWVERQDSFTCPPSECRGGPTRASASYQSLSDKLRVRGPSDRLRSSGVSSELGSVGALPVNEVMDFYWFFSFGFSSAEAYTESQGRQAFEYEDSDYELGAGPIMRVGGIYFGGAVSAVTLRSARHRIYGANARWDHHIEEALLPRIELLTGAGDQDQGLALSLKTFAKDTVEDRIVDAAGVEYILDRDRSLPTVLSLTARQRVGERLRLFARVQRIAAGQASEPGDVDTPRLQYSAGGAAEAKTAEAGRDRDYFRYEISGSYQATAKGAISGRIGIDEPRYRSAQNLDWFDANLGGRLVGIGATVGDEGLKGFFEIDYTLGEKVRHQATASGNDYWYPNNQDQLTTQRDAWQWRCGVELFL